MYSFISIILLSFLAISCGENIPTYKKAYDVTDTNYSNSVFMLTKQNPDCSATSETFFELFLFLEGKFVLSQKDFRVFLTGNFLNSNKVIEQTFYGEDSEIHLRDGRFKSVTYQSPKVLEVCSTDHRYKRESVEGAALNISYFIHKTYRRFKEVNPDVFISPIKLNISPILRRSALGINDDGKVTKKSTYMTDNAFYFSTDRSITYLPHSVRGKASGLTINYWEVPMVAAHEYGHHLFHMIYKHDTKSTDNCFGTTTSKSKGHQAIINNGRKDDVINAYNEGFSDLISFYTLDIDERNVAGVKCLEMSRDVNSTFFLNWKPKRFTEEAVKNFFQSKMENNNPSCEDVNYTDIHSFGAVFAHTIDRFFGYLGYSDNQKLIILAEWVDFLRKEKRKYTFASGETFFRNTYTHLIRMSVEQSSKNFNRKTCKEIDDIYPGLNMQECLSK